VPATSPHPHDPTALPLAGEHLREAVTASPIALCLTSIAGVCVFANAAAEALFGRPADELVGGPVDELFHPGDQAALHAAMQELLDGRGADRQREYRVLRPDGSLVHAVASTTVLHDAAGRPELLFSQLQDLTARRSVEVSLERRVREQSLVAELGRRAGAWEGSLDELIATATEGVRATLSIDGCAVVLHESGGVDGSGGAIPPEMASTLTVPVGPREHPYGTLGAYCRAPGAFGEDERDFLSAIANLLAGAVRRHRAEERMRRQALHDALTGLPNRTLLSDRLGHALELAARNGTHVAVLFVDLDHFKVVNDSLGHEAGDELLCAVAERLCGAVRASDTVARFGGDEFVIVAAGLHAPEEAIALADAIRTALAVPALAGGVEHHIRASVGVRVAEAGEATTVDALLRDADTAMYRAKDSGRGRFEVFDDAARAQALARMQIEQDLRRALDARELRMHFQPFARLTDGRWVGAEALLRWQHPERGLLEPEDFLEVAEQSGLIVPIGNWTLREACRHGARWAAAAGEEFLLTVNLSPRQLADPDLVSTVADSLAASGLRAGSLGLEMTEQALLDGRADSTLAALRELGVKVLLDDFGTGFSSLSHLKRFPIDALKIDRSFVAGVAEGNRDDAAIVRAILAMAWATGKFVIPEGIETPEHAEQLRRFGCRFGQGFLFAHPQPPEAIDAGMDANAAGISDAAELRAAVSDTVLAARMTTGRLSPDRFGSISVRVLAALGRRLPGSAVWIGQLDYEMGVLRVVAADGEGSFGLHAGMEAPVEGSLCHVLAGGGPQLCGDAAASVYAALEVQGELGVGSFVGQALELGGVAAGTLCAIAGGQEAFSEADLQVIRFAATLLVEELLEAVAAGGEDVHEHLRRVTQALA
jgi:diguanylate cyclase (GGDEF)-like protein/PAS domain S-box-containing protein